jgi:DtxR family Mn-dependent transcriptional regulator
MDLSASEQEYIKTIYRISERDAGAVSTNAISLALKTSPPSTTEMIKKLAEKYLVDYKPYYGVTLTNDGRRMAMSILRRQRLWKVFLIHKLRFPWEQIQALTNTLEHIDNDDLIARLDAFLDFPKFDPLGEAIPNSEGRITIRNQSTLLEANLYQTTVLIGVRDDDPAFLSFLSEHHIKLGTSIIIKSFREFDKSLDIILDDQHTLTISKQTAQNLIVKIK